MKSYEVRKPIPEHASQALAPYGELLQKLLYYRGIETADAAHVFLNPDFERDLHDPFLLPNMEAAVARILQAIATNERVTIYADYDADGVPGAVVFSEFLTRIGFTNFDVYIPHRNREGFGLNTKAVQKIADAKTTLLVTIDCGVADVAVVAEARSLGMDVIITDHHEAHEVVPDAIIVNHKLIESKYPERILCGTGVVFKLIQALIARGTFAHKAGTEKWLLDLVGIATLSDMVPLVGENRALAHFGLLVLRKTTRKGLLHLFKKTGTNQRLLTETDVGFSISPRINAASRMGEPEAAFNMLATTDDAEALAHVDHLHHINDMRKGHVAAMVKALHKKFEDKPMQTTNVLVAGNPEWQPSLLGLAASKIAEEYQRPVFLWGRGDGKELKGSCRSVPGVSTLAIMQAAESSFIQYGGHAQAGGFVVAIDMVDTLEQALADGYLTAMQTKTIEPIWADALLDIHDVNASLYQTVRTLAPFGVGNTEPLFMVQNVLIKQVVMFGKTQEHVRLVCHRDRGGDIEAIAFYAKPERLSRAVAPGDRRTIVAKIEQNMWAGRNSVRLRLLDVL
jgi:single-stranded-DNA-specific exonuclease